MYKDKKKALERSNNKHILLNTKAHENHQYKLMNYHAYVRDKQIREKRILTRKERRKIYKKINSFDWIPFHLNILG